jgi:PAS domain S-box-containing protein
MTPIYQHIQMTVAFIVGLLFLSVVLMAIVARWISRPIIQMNQVTKSFASGNWSERLQIHRGDEIGQLASSFNQMADKLQTSLAELQASEARLRAIFENSSEAILMSHNGLQVKGNPAYFKMFAYKDTESLLDKPILEIFAPKERERIGEYVRLRSKGEFAPAHYETLGVKPDGTEFDMEIHVSTFYQNAELYSLGIFQDISERKQSQAALFQQTYELTERLKELNCLYEHSKILEKSDISIEELCHATVNLIPAAWQYPQSTSASIIIEAKRYSTSNFIATEWQQSSPIIVDNEALGILQVSYLNERPMDYEGPFLAEERLLIDELARRLGHKIKALRADASLKQYNETLEKKVVERTKELTLVQDALREALATEKELGELKSRFVSMASHEFRTPLATILALSETLDAYRHKMEEDEIEECLNNIKIQISHLKRLMEDVLLLARMQARRQEFNPVKQNVLPVLRSVIYEFQNRSDIQHQLIFTSNRDEFEAYLDPKLVRQVASNLLSNAIKYSPADRPIEINLECSPEDIILSIKDYGIGIPENDLKHLFEPFHRASNVGIISGTGLGLVITKESVELHGGTINLESHINVGTKFIVRIPVPIEKDSSHE